MVKMIKSLKASISIIALVLFLTSCYKDNTILEIPRNGSLGLLEGTTPLSDTMMKKIEGIYSINSSMFGNKVVLKASGKYLSVFAMKNESYIILQAGFKDSAIILEGYWRFASSSENGLIAMNITSTNGAKSIIQGDQPTNLYINGMYGNGDEYPKYKFDLSYLKPITKTAADYWIIAHRGGGRNADLLPASENSLGIIEYAERFGANAIEIDVRLTKDGVPVLFHDEIMSKRLINEDYFIGKISDYSFAQLRSFCTLKDGERIPTLDEALETVVNKTNLKLVWIDTKSIGMMDKLVALQQKYIALAAQRGKTLEILIGIPSVEVYNDFIQYPNFQNYSSICELDENYVSQSKAKVWASRWSLGLLDDRVSTMHNSGYRCFVWTLDETELIKSFVKKGNFDGIVTNYPSIVAYEYYTSE
jgi:glycerophosphoryl diester phosphodiesterase